MRLSTKYVRTHSSLQTPQDILLKPVVCKINDTLIFRTLVAAEEIVPKT